MSRCKEMVQAKTRLFYRAILHGPLTWKSSKDCSSVKFNGTPWIVVIEPSVALVLAGQGTLELNKLEVYNDQSKYPQILSVFFFASHETVDAAVETFLGVFYRCATAYSICNDCEVRKILKSALGCFHLPLEIVVNKVSFSTQKEPGQKKQLYVFSKANSASSGRFYAAGPSDSYHLRVTVSEDADYLNSDIDICEFVHKAAMQLGPCVNRLSLGFFKLSLNKRDLWSYTPISLCKNIISAIKSNAHTPLASIKSASLVNPSVISVPRGYGRCNSGWAYGSIPRAIEAFNNRHHSYALFPTGKVIHSHVNVTQTSEKSSVSNLVWRSDDAAAGLDELDLGSVSNNPQPLASSLQKKILETDLGLHVCRVDGKSNDADKQSTSRGSSLSAAVDNALELFDDWQSDCRLGHWAIGDSLITDSLDSLDNIRPDEHSFKQVSQHESVPEGNCKFFSDLYISLNQAKVGLESTESDGRWTFDGVKPSLSESSGINLFHEEQTDGTDLSSKNASWGSSDKIDMFMTYMDHESMGQRAPTRSSDVAEVMINAQKPVFKEGEKGILNFDRLESSKVYTPHDKVPLDKPKKRGEIYITLPDEADVFENDIGSFGESDNILKENSSPDGIFEGQTWSDSISTFVQSGIEEGVLNTVDKEQKQAHAGDEHVKIAKVLTEEIEDEYTDNVVFDSLGNTEKCKNVFQGGLLEIVFDEDVKKSSESDTQTAECGPKPVETSQEVGEELDALSDMKTSSFEQMDKLRACISEYKLQNEELGKLLEQSEDNLLEERRAFILHKAASALTIGKLRDRLKSCQKLSHMLMQSVLLSKANFAKLKCEIAKNKNPELERDDRDTVLAIKRLFCCSSDASEMQHEIECELERKKLKKKHHGLIVKLKSQNSHDRTYFNYFKKYLERQDKLYEEIRHISNFLVRGTQKKRIEEKETQSDPKESRKTGTECALYSSKIGQMTHTLETRKAEKPEKTIPYLCGESPQHTITKEEQATAIQKRSYVPLYCKCHHCVCTKIFLDVKSRKMCNLSVYDEVVDAYCGTEKSSMNYDNVQKSSESCDPRDADCRCTCEHLVTSEIRDPTKCKLNGSSVPYRETKASIMRREAITKRIRNRDREYLNRRCDPRNRWVY